ncbi:SPOSA6832_02625 [Sporobolomyces salmonicolor]|uniref:SPOSA6832_02625-mRNA-1:cds n=1 Tax=Sporidiobolus salmonicolor TaxID=5005 RepID=A0A0D6EM03_SPOSA|nr:SPOSA6832_02625 [Sporobolomyces salmonicolor]
MATTSSSLTPISTADPLSPLQASSSSSTFSYNAYRSSFTSALRALANELQARRLAGGASVEQDEMRQKVEALVERVGGWVKREDLAEGDKWKADTRKAIVDRALEELVHEAVSSPPPLGSLPKRTLTSDPARERSDAQAIFPADDAATRHLEDVLDLVLTFVEAGLSPCSFVTPLRVLTLLSAGYAEEVLPLNILTGLMELRPISACDPLFGYIESRVERLTKGMEYQRGRGPILLRLLNDLLRRLPRSKSQPVILSGRILMLLSSVYPLGEKSGVNLRGNFNVGKGTVWEEEAAKEMDGAREDAQKEEGEREREQEKMESPSSFYATFWSLQRYFNNPPLLFASPTTTSASETPLATLQEGLRKTLSAFASETKKEKELTGAATEGKDKEKAVEDVSMEEQDMDKTDESLEQYFFPKFLTSRNLLTLEVLSLFTSPAARRQKTLTLALADPAFRRQILLQTLILFQYLLSFTPSARARAQALPMTNASAFPSFTLSPEDEAWVTELRQQALGEMESMEGGKTFRRAVESVLQREQNWTDWKLRSCIPFTKPAVPVAEHSEKARSKLRVLTRKQKAFPWRMGNPQLSRVWDKNLTTLEGFVPDVACVLLSVLARVAKRSGTDRFEGGVLYSDDEFDAIVREWRMTKKRHDMTAAQVRQLPADTPRAAELSQSLEGTAIKLQALHWRAIRSASGSHLRHFASIGSGDLDTLLSAIDDDRRRKEEAEEAGPAKTEQGELENDGNDSDSSAVKLTETEEKAQQKEQEVEAKAEEKTDKGGDEEGAAGTPPPPGTPKRPRDEGEDAEMKEPGLETKKQKTSD